MTVDHGEDEASPSGRVRWRRRTPCTLVLVLVLLATSIARAPADSGGVAFAQTVPPTRVQYGPHPRNYLLVHAPTGPPIGRALIWIHGGGWSGGQPDLEPPFAHTALAYSAAGYTIITPAYRLSGDAPHPAQIHDVFSVLAWTAANAATLGIDPESIIVGGYSAGGHLASLAGTAWNSSLNPTTPVRPAHVLNLAGPIDPADHAARRPQARPDVAALIGDANPAELAAATWADPDDPPQSISFSPNDPVVPAAGQAVPLERLRGLVDVELVPSSAPDHALPDVDHSLFLARTDDALIEAVGWRTIRPVDAQIEAITNSVVTGPVGAPAAFSAFEPIRFTDTRTRLRGRRLAPGVRQRIQVLGLEGIPAGVSAVTANFTAVAQSGPGYLTVWACEPNIPTVSTVNWFEPTAVANSATVTVDGFGGICVASNTATDLIIDIAGAYQTGVGDAFTPITPKRLLDTRTATPAGPAPITVTVPPLDSTGARPSAVALNVTATEATAPGYISVYPCDQPQPAVSTVNPIPGRSVANSATVRLSAAGTFCIQALSEVDVIVDVVGYFAPSGKQLYQPMRATRLFDTRAAALWPPDGRLGAQWRLPLPLNVLRAAGLPVAAVSANYTAVTPSEPGFATVWGCEPTRPDTSSLNWDAGVYAVPNGATAGLSAIGELCIYTSAPTHIVVDLTGVWLNR